jgi:hypothetical protein
MHKEECSTPPDESSLTYKLSCVMLSHHMSHVLSVLLSIFTNLSGGGRDFNSIVSSGRFNCPSP